MLRKALVLSISGHCLLLLFMTIGDVLFRTAPPITMSTELVFKPGNPRPQDLLPTKATSKSPAKTKPLDGSKIAEQKVHKEPVPIKPVENPAVDKNSEILKNLSDTFSEEILTDEKGNENDDGGVDNYIDLVYSLVKQSFIVPSHLEGPLGQDLKANIRVQISPSGDVKSVKLEEPSKDQSFDMAVIEGIKRVNNFGPPPDALKDTLNRKGILIELCPVKCKNGP